MNPRPYLVISGILFGLVAILHLLRLVNGWAVTVGPWSAPMWISWMGTLFAALLFVWALRLASKMQD